MRGEVERQRMMLSVVSAEHRIPADHPLRRIKALADTELARLSPVFDRMYAERGRPSVPPERLLKACLLIALYSIRSERQLCEQLQYNLLFQWFLDLSPHEEAFDASTFAKNKERLLRADVARLFFEGIVQQAKAARLLSAEHFTVDGTLIEAWASLKSFRPKGERPEDRPPPDDPGNPTVNFHGERRNNATHASITDSDALLARKGEAGLCRACPHGEPARHLRGHPGHPGHRDGRTGGGARDDSPTASERHPAADAGRRQGLRHGRLRRRRAGRRHHAARRAQHHHAARFEPRLADPAPSGLPGEPALPQEDRGDLRLGEDDRRAAQDAVSWLAADGLLGLLRRRGVRPVADGEADTRGGDGVAGRREDSVRGSKTIERQGREGPNSAGRPRPLAFPST